MSFVVSGDAPWIYLDQRELAPHTTMQSLLMAVPENACEQDIARTDVSAFESILSLTTALGGDVVPVRRVRWRDVLSPHHGPIVIDQNDQYGQIVSGWSEDLGWGEVSAEDLFRFEPQRPYPMRIHAAEVAGRVWMLQSVLAATARTIDVTAKPYGQTAFPKRATRVSAQWVAGAFSRFLGVFSPHIRLQPEAFTGERAEVVERPGWPATAMEVAALQLYNAVVREDQFRLCDFCHRPFSSQVGRAKYVDGRNHRRADARFCRPKCQKAAEQRRRRARKRSEQLGAPSASTHSSEEDGEDDQL